MAHSRGLRALALDDVLLADCFLGPVLVVGGEGDHRPAVVSVQNVHALDVDPGVLEPLGYAGQGAGQVRDLQNQDLVSHGLVAGLVQGVQGAVGVVGGDDDGPLPVVLLGVDGLQVDSGVGQDGGDVGNGADLVVGHYDDSRDPVDLVHGGAASLFSVEVGLVRFPVFPSRCAVGDEFVHLLPGDVGHGDDVGLIALGGDLPLSEHLWAGAGKHHGDGVPVSPGGYAVVVETVDGVLGGAEHAGCQVPESLFPVPLQGVPEHQGGEAVAGPGDGGVLDADQFDGAADPFHVALAGQDHPAGEGSADQLVAADGDAVDAGVEAEGLGIVDEGEEHTAEGGVGVDVAAGHAQVMQDSPDAVNVVDGAVHGGADVGNDEGRQVPVYLQHVV